MTSESDTETTSGTSATGNGAAGGPFRSASFVACWSATGISEAGSALTTAVVPVIAATMLGASPAVMSVLFGIGVVIPLILQIPAAGHADRSRRRVAVVSLADAVAAVAVGAIPVMWWAGEMTLVGVVAALVVSSLAGVVRSAYATPIMFGTVRRELLSSANGVLNSTRSAMDIAGKGLAGALLALVAAPVAVLADAVSFLVAAILVRRVRADPATPPVGPAAADAEPYPSLKSIAASLARRGRLWCLIGIAAVNGLTESVFLLYCVDDLKVRPSIVAALLGLGAVGGVIGGSLVGLMVRRLGIGRSVLVGVLVTVCAVAPLPSARPGITAALLIVNFELGGAFGGTIALASVFGEIQGSTAPAAMARTMAVSNNLLQVAALTGLFAGGVVGNLTSVRFTITVCAVAVVVLALVPFALTRPTRPA